MPKVSIIVPVYNVERYLAECLDSIMAQTMPDWEAILIDDGSTDNSGIICDEYAAKDDRFQVIHKENGGAASAKNAGLDHVTGGYIAFLDSDDTVSSIWLETCMIACSGADVVEYAFDRHYVTGYESVPSILCASFSAESYLSQYIENWQCSLFWNKIFRSELLAKVRFRKERRCIDDEFFTYKAVSEAANIIRISDVLYHYRQRKSSAVAGQKNGLQKTDDTLEMVLERYQWIKKRFGSLRKKYLQHQVDNMFYVFSDFDYTDSTAKKFQKVSRYLVKECILHYPGKVTMLYALRLLMISKKRLLNKPLQIEEEPKQGLFV